MSPTDRTRTLLAASFGRVVLPHPVAQGALAAVATAMRENWVRGLLLVPASEAGARPAAGAERWVHDDRLVDRHLGVWEALRRPSGIGAAEARRELSDPETMAAAIVLAGGADAVLAGPRDPKGGLSGGVLCESGSTLSEVFLLGEAPAGVAVQLCAGLEVTPGKLARSAIAGLRIARRVCVTEPKVQFVVGTVTASLGIRRRHESEESAVRTCIDEAVRTLRVRDGSASVADTPLSTIPAPGGDAVVLVFPGSGEDLRYGLERGYAGQRVAGPLVQGTRLPFHRVSREASPEEVMGELTLLMLETISR